MEPQTVSEIPEGVLARLFYTAGAVAGLASGLLEVMTKLLQAAVQVAIANPSLSTHGAKHPAHGHETNCKQQEQEDRQEQEGHQPRLAFAFVPQQAPESSPAGPSTPKADDPFPHVPADTSGAPSAATSGHKSPSQATPIIQSPRTLIEEGTLSSEAIPIPSDAPSGESALAVPTNTPATQHDPNHAAKPELTPLIDLGAIVGNAALFDASGRCSVAEMAPEVTVIPAATTVDADAAPGNDPDNNRAVLPAATPEGEESTPADVTAPLKTFWLPGEAAEPLAEPTLDPASFSTVTSTPRNEISIRVDSPEDGSGLAGVGPSPVIEPNQEVLMVSEPVSKVALQPDQLQSLSASRVVAAMHEGDEAMRSESGENGITAVSCGPAGTVDPVIDAPTSRKLKTALASALTGSLAAATPGVSYSQRLEEKRQSSRRKGTQKAKAR